jgi:AcrR family transcriptional regulator
MIAKFLALDEQKQAKIINAAIQEFTQKDYKTASTNQIVQTAEISKGLLFHYFTNKKGLYLYLYDHCIGVILDDFFGEIDYRQKDILLRFRQMLMIKFQLMNKYPLIFEFLTKANQEELPEIKVLLNNRNQTVLQESYQKMFAQIDVSLFRSDMDAQKAKQIIIWTIEGLSSQVQARDRHKRVEQLQNGTTLQELDAYLDILRKVFYT